MKKKVWTNSWVCSPEFGRLRPLQLLHRQLDPAFHAPEHREDLMNFHALFRQKFFVKPGTKQVYLDISADDYYKLYVNGSYVSQGPASSYSFCYYYNQVDLTPYLKEGENVLAVHVYYQGLVNRALNSGDYRQGLIAELFADGRLLPASPWKCQRAQEYGFSRTIAYDTQFNEIIDQNWKLEGWKDLDFNDTGWETAWEKRDDDHVLELQPTPPVQVELRRPAGIRRIRGGWFLDFGEELTGSFTMCAEGAPGDLVRIRMGEELNPDGRVRYDMRCNCFYEDQWILSSGRHELEQFDYKCFRYVEVLAPEGVKAEEFAVWFRHYPYEEGAYPVRWKEPLIGQIWEICSRAVRNCAQESFLDCPSREKGQYLGDLTVTAHAFHYLTGDDRLFRKALLDFSHSSRICPGLMAVAPGSYMQEIADFSLLYPYQLLLYYRFTEDREFLSQMEETAEGVERYFDQFQNQDGLLENVKTKWNLVDWPENLRDGYDFDLSQPVAGDGCHNVINALYIGMKQCMERIRSILGKEREKESEHLRQAYVKTFYRQDRGLFVDSSVSSHSSLHSNVFAAFYGLEPEGNQIVPLIREKGLCCGVFVSYFVLYALVRMGERQLAWDFITGTSEHSWYNMIQQGATTAYEAWGKDQKWNTSLCHGWAAAPIPVLAECF